MIWIIGEYEERIENDDEILERLLEGFNDEKKKVKIKMIKEIVKLFMKRNKEKKELVKKVMSLEKKE
jgi:vesicle coat complex subunit